MAENRTVTQISLTTSLLSMDSVSVLLILIMSCSSGRLTTGSTIVSGQYSGGDNFLEVKGLKTVHKVHVKIFA